MVQMSETKKYNIRSATPHQIFPKKSASMTPPPKNRHRTSAAVRYGKSNAGINNRNPFISQFSKKQPELVTVSGCMDNDR